MVVVQQLNTTGIKTVIIKPIIAGRVTSEDTIITLDHVDLLSDTICTKISFKCYFHFIYQHNTLLIKTNCFNTTVDDVACYVKKAVNGVERAGIPISENLQFIAL